LRPVTTVTSFHHQPEAQHLKSSAIHKLGRPITPSFRDEADMPSWAGHVCKWPLADVLAAGSDVRFSNRPFEVKHFQTIRRCNVDVAHGLALLFGIGTRALPSWDSRTR
jgi:hypothetical protein